MSLTDSLEELPAVISNVTDLENAEDLTEIYEDITNPVLQCCINIGNL